MKLTTALVVGCNLLAILSLCGSEALIPAGDLGETRHVSFGRGDVAGYTQNLTTPGGVPRSSMIFYNFTNTASRDNSFIRLHFDKEVPGVPSSVTVGYENPEKDSIPIAAFLTDRSGEVYLARGTAAPGTGEVTIPMPNVPAWPSGDQNNRIDYPLMFNFLMLEQPPEQRVGSLFITRLDFSCQVDADSALGGKIQADEYHFGVNSIPVSMRFTPYLTDLSQAYECALVINDNYTGKELRRQEIPLALPLAESDREQNLSLELPFGSFNLALEIVNPATGKLVSRSNCRVQVMTAGCDQYASDAERLYEFHYGPIGGCLDFTTPADSEKLGRRWFRFEGPNWKDVETERGRYDVDKVLKAAAPWLEHNVRLNTLQTLYAYPEFYTPGNLPDFAAGYGHYLQAFAEGLKGKIETHELGNEDNGANKFLYTEVARHGAAGIRSRQPFAFLGNSGTAHIDYNWLKFQIDRGLFDTLDALLVHPYTNNSTCTENASFEQFDSLTQLDRLHELLFEAGGMKELWNTEFGWPNGDQSNEQARARLYVRALILNDAADIRTQVVYNWDRDYNTVHYAAGVPLHQFARRRQAARFVGLLTDPESGIYTAVYDNFGKPFAIQWTTREGSFAPTVTGKFSDMFGNPVPASEVKITQAVTYIDDIDPAVVTAAARANVEKLAARFQEFLKRNPEKGFERFAAVNATDTAKLRSALLAWLNSRNAPINRTEQALFDSALRWYLAAARDFPAGRAERQFEPGPFRELVEKENAALLDPCAVRYLLRQADKLTLEAQLAKNDASRNAALSELSLLQRACEVFAKYGERIQYAVFTNLYMMNNGELGEKLFFVPTVPTTVKFQVSSYAPTAQKVTVRPVLPEGWKGEAVSLEVPANGSAWGELVITAPSGADAKKISIATELPGKPARVTSFNSIEYLPAVTVEIPLLEKRPGQLPLRFENKEDKVVSGQVKLMPAGIGGAPLALLPIELPARGEKLISAQLDANALLRLAQAGYALDARFLLDDGRVFDVKNLDADFGVAARRDPNGAIDGDLSDWSGALPIKLNKDAYTYGSFGNSWSPDDLSAVTYLAWDEEKLYFAAEVTDQVFNQTGTEDGVWAQDSIQLLLTADADETNSGKIEGIWLALTPLGPKAWHERAGRHIANCELFINYEHGKFIYEFAVPWTEIGPEFVKSIQAGKFGYAIAINDDDVLVPRRFLERFKGSVVHGRDLATFADIVLEREAAPVIPPATGKLKFYDNFDAYEENSLPAGYVHVHNNVPHDLTLVVKGVGEHGGNALRMTNSIGVKPHHFCTLTSEVRTEPGKRYRVDFRLKGRNCNRASLGLCSDLWGNQDFSYLQLPENIPNWTTFSREFTGPATGKIQIIVRNLDFIGELLIDEISLVEL